MRSPIHVLAVAVLYLLLAEISGIATLALAGAAVFAVHPLWSEAVTSIADAVQRFAGFSISLRS